MHYHAESYNCCVCVCYHPPRPVYQIIVIRELLHRNFEHITYSFPNDVMILTGDLNHLDYGNLLVDFGLSQIVTSPTRLNSILDVFITNRPDMFPLYCSQIDSCHWSLLCICELYTVSCCEPVQSDGNSDNRTDRCRVKCYNRFC